MHLIGLALAGCLLSLVSASSPGAGAMVGSWCLLPLLQVSCGIEMPFLLVAKDTSNHRRSSGGDVFEIAVESEAGVVVGSSRIVDRGNGLYECFYRWVPLTTVACNLQLAACSLQLALRRPASAASLLTGPATI